MRWPGRTHDAATCTVFEYVAVPEKYFTPGSELSVHDISFSMLRLDGAPRLSSKCTSQGAANVVSTLSDTAGSVREGAVEVWRKTTNTDSRSASSSRTVVNPSCEL